MQYLVSLLGQANQPLTSMFMGGMPDSGRMGDYVFTQEGECQSLDEMLSLFLIIFFSSSIGSNHDTNHGKFQLS